MSMSEKQIRNATDFASVYNVSRETLDRLEVYVDVLSHWQKRINLIGRSTVGDIWHRHVADSAQLAVAPFDRFKIWLDLGSGAGLPGIVLAILLAPSENGHVHLVESQGKKCAFLREAIRQTQAPATVHNARIEKLDEMDFDPTPDVVTSRALASILDLLGYSENLVKNGTPYVFFKGQDIDAELTEAAKYWNITARKHVSRIHSEGCILLVEENSRDHIES